MHGKAPRLGLTSSRGFIALDGRHLPFDHAPKPRAGIPGAPGVRVTVVSAFHRSEVERPPRTTVKHSTVRKGSL